MRSSSYVLAKPGTSKSIASTIYVGHSWTDTHEVAYILIWRDWRQIYGLGASRCINSKIFRLFCVCDTLRRSSRRRKRDETVTVVRGQTGEANKFNCQTIALRTEPQEIGSRAAHDSRGTCEVTLQGRSQ